MGLINLKTNLKSLKYGADRMFGANSGQPYITSPIPKGDGDFFKDPDFLLRGGIGAIQDTAEDVLRLGKMFMDIKSPNGLLFIAKQKLLSQTAVRTQTSNGDLNGGSYSPLNTLAQAGVIAFGRHLNKQGENPFAETGVYSTNENLYGVKVTSAQSKEKNRLVDLYKTPNIENVISYPGGPGSNLGQGQTIINYSRLSQTPLTSDSKIYLDPNFSTLNVTDWVYDTQLVKDYENKSSYSSPNVQDFRAVLRNKLGISTSAGKQATDVGATSNSQPYNIGGASNISQRVNIGDPGQRGAKSYANYSKGVQYLEGDKTKPNTLYDLDKINSLPIYRSQSVDTKNTKNDLVKFRIAVIDNDNPSFKTFMHFRAFLGPISDSYSAIWNGFNYLGRGEQFYTYGGFGRTISLSWTVAAQSKGELIPMYKKLNYLASSLAPDYSSKGYMRGNLVQLTIGGYLFEQPGFITSLTYDIQDDTPWEIGIGVTEGSGDGTVKELPHIIRVTGFQFTPIHNFIPQKQELSFGDKLYDKLDENDIGPAQSYGRERFIALSNGNSNYDYFNSNDKNDSFPPEPPPPSKPEPKSIPLPQKKQSSTIWDGFPQL